MLPGRRSGSDLGRQNLLEHKNHVSTPLYHPRRSLVNKSCKETRVDNATRNGQTVEYRPVQEITVLVWGLVTFHNTYFFELTALFVRTFTFTVPTRQTVDWRVRGVVDRFKAVFETQHVHERSFKDIYLKVNTRISS